MKAYVVVFALLTMSTLAQADDLANVSIEKYLQLRQTAPETVNTYMSGVAVAFALSNAMLERDKHPNLYCPPPDLVIDGRNLQNLVDPMVANDLGLKGADTTSVAGLALAVLANIFPCK